MDSAKWPLAPHGTEPLGDHRDRLAVRDQVVELVAGRQCRLPVGQPHLRGPAERVVGEGRDLAVGVGLGQRQPAAQVVGGVADQGRGRAPGLRRWCGRGRPRDEAGARGAVGGGTAVRAPVKLAVTVPRSRVFIAVRWYQGRFTVLVRTLPPLPE